MRFYAVVEVNQASRMPEDLDGPYTDFLWAKQVATEAQEANHANGRRERFYVAELVEVLP